MDGLRFGLQFRALRLRLDLRQADVGGLAHVSRGIISRIERGLTQNLQIGTLERAAGAVGATVDVRLRWRGEQLDRLLDEAHALLVEQVVSLLGSHRWNVAVEASFSIWGERGSIDVLAHHPATGSVLVVEVKSIVPDNQSTLHGLDRKGRLARQVATDRGWQVSGVSRLLAIGDSSVSRRRVARLGATYDATLPVRGAAMRRWLREPAGQIAGLLFLAYAPRGSAMLTRPARLRVRKRDRLRRRSESSVNALPESIGDKSAVARSPCDV